MNFIEHDYRWQSSLAKRKKTTLIVLHHAAATECIAEDIHRWHLANGWAGIGYHYLVRKDGSIHRGRPEDTVGAHALNSNSISVGVCFEGNFETETMPDLQLTAGAELVADLMRRYQLGVNAIRGHRDVNATACPGSNFPFEAITVAAEAINAVAPAEPKENLVLSFQKAAITDGYSFVKYGADGKWGAECDYVASRCVVKKRATYQNKNATRLVQRLIGVTADGKCGPATDKAIRAYQKANGLTVDGAVGKATWRKLLGV